MEDKMATAGPTQARIARTARALFSAGYRDFDLELGPKGTVRFKVREVQNDQDNANGNRRV